MSDEATNNRTKPRIGVRFGADYKGRRTSGTGVVLNISESGALIGDAQPLLVEGGRIRIKFSFYENSLPVEIPAQVVRETDNGFAVRFSDLDARTRSLLSVAIRKAMHRAKQLEEEEPDATLTSLF